VYVMLNGTAYNYGRSYWIMGGNYNAYYESIVNGTYTYGVTTLEIFTSQGSQTYYFPNLSSYLYINSTMTYYWHRL